MTVLIDCSCQELGSVASRNASFGKRALRSANCADAGVARAFLACSPARIRSCWRASANRVAQDMTVRLVLFGSPSVEHNGESTALPRERRSQLLAYLALKRAWVSRTDLAALLWPDQPGKLAYTNLRKTLFRAQSLPWARGLEVQTQALRFLPATDVVEFEAALREDRVADALPLWRGELLAGFDDAGEAWTGWLQFERDRVRSAWRNAALTRLGEDIDAAEAVELSTRLLEADPLDEAALAVHMSWLARAGQNARARQTYRDFAERLSS